MNDLDKAVSCSLVIRLERAASELERATKELEQNLDALAKKTERLKRKLWEYENNYRVWDTEETSQYRQRLNSLGQISRYKAE
jgi:predicted RNase H-like nuclease (RuvC/YqgF family)